MPICVLLVPEAASQGAKLALMGRLSSHIHEAYPVTTTHIFVHEAKFRQTLPDEEGRNESGVAKQHRICAT
jgi:hypothetical protein